MNPEFQPQMSQMNTDGPAAEKHLRPSVPSAAKKEPAPKISVIVPVYKVEKYLPECIESVLAQTFTDFELILVDDGSPDNSGAICDAYAARDPRIRVFHKQNGGVSSARNLGLDNAKGEWIAFVDSDDWICPFCLEILYRKALEKNPDIVLADYWKDQGRIQISTEQRLPPAPNDITGVMRGFFEKKLVGVSYAKLFRKKLLEDAGIRFPENVRFAEDFVFCAEAFCAAESWEHCARPVYHYRGQGYATSNYHLYFDDWKIVLERIRAAARRRAVDCEELIRRHEQSVNFAQLRWAPRKALPFPLDLRCLPPKKRLFARCLRVFPFLGGRCSPIRLNELFRVRLKRLSFRIALFLVAGKNATACLSVSSRELKDKL